MISWWVGTQFSSMIYDSNVGHRRWRFQRQPWTWVYADDFWFGRDLVFVNDFWLWCSLWAMKISASAVELGSGDDFWSSRTLFSSMISDSDGGHGRWRFQRQPWNWVPLMISCLEGTQFSSMISDSNVGHGCWRFQRQCGSRFRWWFLVI